MRNEHSTMMPEIRMSPLCAAVFQGNSDSVKELLGSEDLELQCGSSGTPLLLAIARGYEDIAVTLIERGADVNARRSIDGKTALILAVDRGFADLSQRLIRGGADVNARDAYGYTPLSLAVGRSDNTLLVRLLRLSGARDDPSVATGGANGSVQREIKSVYTVGRHDADGRSALQRSPIVIGEPEALLPELSSEVADAARVVGVRFHVSFKTPSRSHLETAWIHVQTQLLDGQPISIVDAQPCEQVYEMEEKISVQPSVGINSFKLESSRERSVKLKVKTLRLFGLGKEHIVWHLQRTPYYDFDGQHEFDFRVKRADLRQVGCSIRVECVVQPKLWFSRTEKRIKKFKIK